MRSLKCLAAAAVVAVGLLAVAPSSAEAQFFRRGYAYNYAPAPVYSTPYYGPYYAAPPVYSYSLHAGVHPGLLLVGPVLREPVQPGVLLPAVFAVDEHLLLQLPRRSVGLLEFARPRPSVGRGRRTFVYATGRRGGRGARAGMTTMADQQSNKGKKGNQKTFATKRTANPPAGPNEEGLNTEHADQDQDAKHGWAASAAAASTRGPETAGGSSLPR